MHKGSITAPPATRPHAAPAPAAAATGLELIQAVQVGT